MIESGQIFPRQNKRRARIGINIPKWCVLCVLAACGLVASGQSLPGSGSDWANLPSPPATPETNSPDDYFDSSNAPTDPSDFLAQATLAGTNDYSTKLAMARYFRKTMQPGEAEGILVSMLASDVPEKVQKEALLELGGVVRDENDLPRAQTIYAQFLNRWPDDSRSPEVYLRQGEIFRQMGLTDLALTKFYSVMASALAIKNDQEAYYQKLVLQTQVEIAETHYLMGHFVDAADFYKRLLTNPDPALNRPQMEFRLVRSLTIIGQNDEAVSQGQDFLSRYPDADETPEIRYYLAQALKSQGRDEDALQQVLLCLQQQKAKSGNDPAVWTYWQQRVGNEIGNQLYHQGDYVHALEIYVVLAQLDSSAAWQIPVYYQMGLTYEKLAQPEMAEATYGKIIAQETAVGTNATPGMQAVFGMAKWRVNFLKWQQNAQAVDQTMVSSMSTNTLANSTTNSANE